jgi:hypothetical protein
MVLHKNKKARTSLEGKLLYGKAEKGVKMKERAFLTEFDVDSSNLLVFVKHYAMRSRRERISLLLEIMHQGDEQ